MKHPYADIPELSNLAAGRGLVRIPCEQDVPFTPRVRALVDTAEFQRLAHITQLGLASRVYPGARHTRFEHALGVFHNALKYLWQLGRDRRFTQAVDRHRAEVLLASALLHDLGHWPFCHPIEDMALPDLPPHEQFAREFLAEKGDRSIFRERPEACGAQNGPVPFSSEGELAEVLRDAWNIEPDEVLDVLAPHTDTPAMRLMRSLLSGPIDVDKLDYLDRDSLHAGVPYGRNFDRQRLIASLVVNEAGDGLAITSKGKTAAELMVFARYVMFSEVYWHHAVRSATSMFARAFFHLHTRLELPALFRRTEAEMIDVLRHSAAGTACEPLLEGIFGPRRMLYKRLLEFSHDQSPEVYERLARRPFAELVQCAELLAVGLGERLGSDVAATDVLIDAPPPQREIEFRVDVYDVKRDSYRPLAEVSPVIEALAHRQFDDYVKRVRVFVHQRLRDAGQDGAAARAVSEMLAQL